MPNIDALQAKRAALVASQDQLVGQINRVGGAIAVIDELVSEEQAREAAADEAARNAKMESALPMYPGSITCAPCGGNTAPSAPTMLPVSKFEPCDDCSTEHACNFNDECRANAPYFAPAGDAA